MEVRLDGRSAIITGGSKGLGLAMAKEFAASGADVAILARDPDTLAEAKAVASVGAQGRVETFSCDVSKAVDIQNAHEAVVRAFGHVDILINNAGQTRSMPSDQITDDIWREDLDLKVFAAIRLTRLVWPGMKQRKWGRIINVLNTGAKTPQANGAPTVVSRAAGMALMKVLAGEGAPHGILVNGMLVGQIVSDQIACRYRAEGTDVSFEDYVAKAGANIPVGRMGKAEEFAAMACFLCSDHAGFTAGTAINMDGGASPVV
ncbi:SDR family oxidoreductase [Kutzneria viridogrisea]|uniref:NAD(P)-dependent dehydrogenase (Short-subunit alcohol dehydrogenase family) n=1 Tax=Kutzneria viridogrisea TaxID=47990 RepID=A0ABR6B9U2_9PSEU|nr:NAD(P)-dependent dehydrogenase (short-subunit alcohol dehydrogenase family) [Kutzneria viridogrisea]